MGCDRLDEPILCLSVCSVVQSRLEHHMLQDTLRGLSIIPPAQSA